MKYYKVVNKQLRSGWTPPKYKVTYVIGEWVYPKLAKSKLFCFYRLDDALNYFGVTTRLFECSVVNPIKLKRISTSSLRFEEFWAGNSDPYWICQAPLRIIGADAIRLDKEISYD